MFGGECADSYGKGMARRSHFDPAYIHRSRTLEGEDGIAELAFSSSGHARQRKPEVSRPWLRGGAWQNGDKVQLLGGGVTFPHRCHPADLGTVAGVCIAAPKKES